VSGSSWKPDTEVRATFKDDGREEGLIEITNEDASATYCYAVTLVVARAVCLAMNKRSRMRKLEQALLHTQAMLAAYRDEQVYEHPTHGVIKTLEEFKYLVIDPLAGNDQQVLEQNSTLPKMGGLERPVDYWERVLQFVEDHHKVSIRSWLPEMDEDVDPVEAQDNAADTCKQAIDIAKRFYGIDLLSPYTDRSMTSGEVVHRDVLNEKVGVGINDLANGWYKGPTAQWLLNYLRANKDDIVDLMLEEEE